MIMWCRRKLTNDQQNTHSLTRSSTQGFAECLPCSRHYARIIREQINPWPGGAHYLVRKQIRRHTITEPSRGVSDVCRSLQEGETSPAQGGRGRLSRSPGGPVLHPHEFSCTFTLDTGASSHVPTFFHDTERFLSAL